MRLQVGQRVLHFVLERKLGEGGFGEVWLAKAGMAGTALKFVSVAGEDLEKGRKEYNRIRWGIEKGLFNHDRLIKMNGVWLLNDQMEEIPDAVLESAQGGRTMELKDAVVEPDTLLIQMDLGQESLASMLKRLRKDARDGEAKGLPIDRLLPFIWQAAEGIDFLNTPRIGYDGQPVAAVYHCDIKPENLLLMDDGKVKICDYGVARIEGKAKTRSPNALSLAHASPELVDDQPCAQSDQYSLAITYVQLRTGRLPFKPDVISGTWRTVMRAVARGDLELDLLTDSAERAVIKRATSLNPTKRYPTATDMAEALWRAVSPETVPTGRIPIRRKSSSGKFALVAVAMAALIGCGVWYFRPGPTGTTTADKDNDPVVTADKVKPERDAWRAKVRDASADPADQLAAFDALAKIAEGKFEAADLEALEGVVSRVLDGAASELDQAILTDDQKSNIESRVKLAEGYVSHEALAGRDNTLLSRARLAAVRLALHQQWPQPSETPPGQLNLFDGDTSSLSDSDGGLSGTDLDLLKGLRTLKLWPGRSETLDVASIKVLVPELDAVLSGDKLASAEQLRLSELKNKASADVTALLDQNDEALPQELEPQITTLFGMDFFQLRLNSVIKALNAGNAAAAQAKLAKLSAQAKNPAQKAAAAWVALLTKLYGEGAEEALEQLPEKFAGASPGDREMLANVLNQRFVKATASAQDLPLLDLAVPLAQKLDPKQTSAAGQVQAKLIAQRLATRLLLPESGTDSWSQWKADVDLANQLADAEKAALESDANWVGFPLLKIAQAELAAVAAPPVPAKLAEARAAMVRIKAQKQQLAAIDKQYPGYLAYVEALLAPTDQAAALAALFVDSSGGSSTTTVIPALTWQTRRDAAAGILLKAASALRAQPVADLSQPPFQSADAPAALRYIQSIEQLTSGAPSPELNVLRLLVQASDSDLTPAAVVELVDKLLPEESSQDTADIAPLLVASALAHTQLHQKDSASPDTATADAQLAVERFARAFKIYEAWAAEQPEDLTRDERLEERVLRSARAAAKPFLRADGSQIDAELKPAVAQVAATVARVYVNLSNAGMLPQDSEMTARVIANWLSLANRTSAEPQQDLLKLEGAWLRDMLVRGEGGVGARLVELKRLVTGDDPESMALRGIATFFEYRQQSDWPARKRALEESLSLFDQAIGGYSIATPQNARYFLDRGGVNLQLAYVQYKGQSEFAAAEKSIKDYLNDALKDAAVVAEADQLPNQLRVEAYNLTGNASEDMYFYEADVAGDRIDFHYKNATDAFDQAFSLDALSPDAQLNRARCTFRYGRAQRLYQGAERFDDAKVRAGLDSANQAVSNAVSAWGDAKTEKKAEALYWQAEILDELANLTRDAAERAEHQRLSDAKVGEAAAIARELGDSRWAAYQLQWARAAFDQNQMDVAKTRLQEIIDAFASAQASTANARTLKVDKSALSDAVYMLIRLQTTVDAARGILRTYVPMFAGQDPVDLACEARVRLAFANALLAKPELYTEVVNEADRVLTLTDATTKYNMREVFRAQANFLLGRVAFQSIRSTDTPVRQAEQATRSADFHEAGMKEVAGRTDIDSQEIWLSNAFRFKDAAVLVFQKSTDADVRLKQARAVHKCLNEFERRMDNALPGRKLNGKVPQAWKREVATYRQTLLSRGFPPETQN